MRLALAIVVAGVAVAGVVYLSSLKLNAHGSYICTRSGISTGFGSGGVSKCKAGFWTADRAVWQIPVAIVIAAVGFGAAVVIARSE